MLCNCFYFYFIDSSFHIVCILNTKLLFWISICQCILFFFQCWIWINLNTSLATSTTKSWSLFSSSLPYRSDNEWRLLHFINDKINILKDIIWFIYLHDHFCQYLFVVVPLCHYQMENDFDVCSFRYGEKMSFSVNIKRI